MPHQPIESMPVVYLITGTKDPTGVAQSTYGVWYAYSGQHRRKITPDMAVEIVSAIQTQKPTDELVNLIVKALHKQNKPGHR